MTPEARAKLLTEKMKQLSDSARTLEARAKRVHKEINQLRVARKGLLDSVKVATP